MLDADIVAREIEGVAPRLPAAAAVLLARWKTLSERAGHASAAGRAGLARSLYEEALEQAEAVILLAHQLPTEEVTWLAPVLYELSCRHVADWARQLRDSVAEGVFLYRAFERLMLVGEEQDAPMALRTSCVVLAPSALAALMAYLHEHGPEGLAERHSARMVATVRQVQRAAQALREQQARSQTGVRTRSGVRLQLARARQSR